MGLFEQRLDGSEVDVEDYEAVSVDDDDYWKTNSEYDDAVDNFVDTMDGTDE